MKVLSIQPYDKRGGPGIQHLNFIKASSKLGIRHYVFIRENHEMISEFRNECAGICTFKSVHGFIPRTASPFRWTKYINIVRKLRDEIAAYAKSIDAETVWTLNEAFPAGPLAAHKVGIRSATQFFGMTSYKPRPVGLAMMFFHKRYSDALIPCQSVIKKDLINLGFPEERIRVVHNGVNTEDLIELASKSQPPLAPITVAMVAGLDRRKGHLYFISAAAIANKTDKSIRFNIHGSLKGDEKYLKEITDLIKYLNLEKIVTLTGPVPSVHNCLTNTHIFCIPSKIEALSVAGLEAMAIGLPIVATNVGGNSIAVIDGENGLLSAPDNPGEMANAIIRLSTSKSMRESYSAASRAHAVNSFSLPVVAVQLNDALGI